MQIIRSVSIFVLAGLCEIGGGYLIWLWMKSGKPFWYAILGMIILGLYGFVAGLQSAGFGRVYATYGGFFIVMSLIWAYKAEEFRPDKYDILGTIIALAGVLIIYFGPRK